MKESLDALSWERVAAIGKILQDEASPAQRFELASELVAISQANTSLLGKLGVSTDSLSGVLMPSGIEMLYDVAAPNFSAGNGGQAASILHPVVQPTTTMPDLSDDMSLFFLTPDHEASSFIPRGNVAHPVSGSSNTVKDYAGSGNGTAAYVHVGVPQAASSAHAAQDAFVYASEREPSFGSQDIREDMYAAIDRLRAKGGSQGTEDSLSQSVFDDIVASLGNKVAPVDVELVAQRSSGRPRPRGASSDGRAFASMGDLGKRAGTAPQSGATVPVGCVQPQEFARFKQIYTSKDGSLCLYEDGSGHVVAVDSSRFA